MAAHHFRTAEEAGAATDVSPAELALAAGHDGPIAVWCVAAGRSCVLSNWAQRRRLAAHGVSGTALVSSADLATQLFLMPQRVHICRTVPCGAKYDNRVPPYLVHGILLSLMPAAGEVAAPAVVEASVAEEAPMAEVEEAPVVEGAFALAAPPVVEEAPVVEAPILEGAFALAAPPKPPVMPGPPLVDSPATTIPGDITPGGAGDAEDFVDRPGDITPGGAEDFVDRPPSPPSPPSPPFQIADLVGMTPLRRECLQECLEQDAAEFAAPFKDLPLLLFLAFAIDRNMRVMVTCGVNDVDIVSEYIPWAIPPALAGSWHEQHAYRVLATSIGVESGSEHRFLQWPATLLQVSHWHVCVEVSAHMCLPPHNVCGGLQCGGASEVCAGPLLAVLSEKLLLALPTACDGDCGVDVCLYWEGKPRTPESRLALRRWFADWLRSRRDDDQWLLAYDTFCHPNWEAKADKRALAPAIGIISAGASDLIVGETNEPELLDALAWASGWHGGKERPPDDALHDLARNLPEVTKKSWLARFRSTAGRELANSPARLRGELPKRRNRSYMVGASVKLAHEYLAVSREQGWKKKALHGFLEKFLAERGKAADRCSKAHFHRVVLKLRGSAVARAATTHALAVSASTCASLAGRRRLCGQQGIHLIKAPVIRELLFQWFCKLRGAIKGRLPLKLLEGKAMALRQEYIRESLSRGVHASVPSICPKWLYIFRKKYNISLRRPNRRWKVPRKVLLSRLRCMWLNTIRVRALALLLLKYDLEADGFDQKPVHRNEAGSKLQPTLSIKGCPEIAIKELHSETRERFSVNTLVTSRRALALAGPPVEVLFKGGAGIEADLLGELPSIGMPCLFVAVSNSGSYRMEHILTYLEKVLARPPGDDNRWRLLFCDCYRPHEGDAVLRLAWKHRYIVLIHGGGTTGVTQVNDTHLHGPFSKLYQELEMQDCFHQMSLNPHGCPRRDRKRCLRDVALTWRRTAMHVSALAGWKANLILNALDGSEDHLASSFVAELWNEVKMGSARERAIEDICREFEAGRVEWSFEFVYSLVERFETTGFMDHYDEGQEDEGSDDNRDDQPWDDRDGPSEDDDDEDGLDPGCAAKRSRACGAEASAPSDDMTPAQQAEVAHFSQRLDALRRCEESAAGEASLLNTIHRVRRQIYCEAAGRRSEQDSVVAQSMRRHQQQQQNMAEQLRLEMETRARERDAQDKAFTDALLRLEARLGELRQHEAALALAGQRAAELEAATHRRRALEQVSQGFTVRELGNGFPGGGGERCRRNRLDLLNCVRRLGRELPAEVEANWKRWTERFDAEGVARYNRAWGMRLQLVMANVVRELVGGGDGGEPADPVAFLRWYRQISAEWILHAGGSGDISVPGIRD